MKKDLSVSDVIQDSQSAENEKYKDVFQKLLNSPELNLQVYDVLPIPIEIFAPDGTAVFANRAMLEFININDASLLVGKYNLRTDPVCIEICGKENIERVFRGEALSFPDFPAPIWDLVDRGVVEEKPWEAATMDLVCQPVRDGDEFICTIVFFTVKYIYHGRTEVVRAQEYIDHNWLEDFDIDKIARSSNLSSHYFSRLFKNLTGMSPYDYYRNTKIRHIKEKLRDPDLSIGQAFAECGVDSKGSYFRLFRESVKMTPSEYRDHHVKK